MRPSRIRTTLLLALALCAGCRDEAEVPAAPPIAPQDRAKFVDAAVLAAMPVPKVVDDARVRALLEPSPSAEALEWFSEEALYDRDDTRFLSTLMALVGSRNEHVARLASDMVSGAYVVALSSGFDVAPAIEVALKSPSAATRRLVVRNLGLPECAAARAWLKAHEGDDGADETDPQHATVASEVKLAFARLTAAAAVGRSVAPTDRLEVFECDVGRTEHVPIPGAEGAIEITASGVLVGTHTRSAASPPEPVVTARVAMQTPAGVAFLALDKKDARIYSFGINSTHNAYLLAWSRAVARNRVRFWFRAVPPEGGK